MDRKRATQICIFSSLVILCIFLGLITGCTKDSSVEVIQKKKISGNTVAVCRFPDQTIRLALKTQEEYKPFHTVYEADVKDVPTESIQIQTGYQIMEHDSFRIKYLMEPFDQYEYEMDYFAINEEGVPITLAICKNQVYLADLDGDDDSEVITVIKGSEKEGFFDTVLVYDWQDGRTVVSNVNESARKAYNLPEEAPIDIKVKLPDGYSVGYPDANIFPEYGAFMKFKYNYSTPDGVHGDSSLQFKHLIFEPFQTANY